MQRVCVGASVAFEHRLGQKRAPLGRWVLATSFPEKTLRLEGVSEKHALANVLRMAGFHALTSQVCQC